MTVGNCRFCGMHLNHLFCDLGMSPLSNSYLTKEQLYELEPFYPLEVYVCESCFLVQIEEFETPDKIFSDYAYFSSYSDTWLKHSKTYVDKMIRLFGLTTNSYVVEIASNDGYLLQYFVENKIPVLGIEPAKNVVKEAVKRGVPTETVFFSTETARRLVAEGKAADLLLGKNVLPHVPDLNDFVAGLKIALKPQGVITMEFPHLMRLMEGNQFDTIYHEHFSYFSYLTVERVFAFHGLIVFDVEELSTHGGSLRIYARHETDSTKPVLPAVSALKRREINAGYTDTKIYLNFAEKVRIIKRDLLSFLIKARKNGNSIVGYGAPAKGNTLLNYCGIRTDFIDYTVDRSPYKQGLYLPGTHIPVCYPDKIKETKPDFILILPWNIKEEIIEQISYVREWGCKFIVPIPRVEILD